MGATAFIFVILTLIGFTGIIASVSLLHRLTTHYFSPNHPVGRRPRPRRPLRRQFLLLFPRRPPSGLGCRLLHRLRHLHVLRRIRHPPSRSRRDGEQRRLPKQTQHLVGAAHPRAQRPRRGRRHQGLQHPHLVPHCGSGVGVFVAAVVVGIGAEVVFLEWV